MPKVGDLVRMNWRANSLYSLTTAGSIGRVMEASDEYPPDLYFIRYFILIGDPEFVHGHRHLVAEETFDVITEDDLTGEECAQIAMRRLTFCKGD